ncbi:MAG: VanW family protein, partial [Lachnospiraceae bacterium]|nr:VanW family protein [Lachnospiraceae bacterium]
VNGSVLLPGEEISVAKKLQPITEENGYAEGTAYENGQVVPSIGGGVYQISSTLYNAAILAELDITERSEHSMTVSYVDPSRDAAIAGDVKDLKFKNNLDSPIYIDLQTSDSAITATIFGEETRPANREVEFEAEILGRTDPKTVYVADGSQPIGYKSGGGDAHTGYSAQLLKIVKVDGEEQSREVFNKSYYSVKNIEYHIGTASASGEASAAMHAAVASQDIGAINAAISQWNASAVAARAAEAQAAEAQAAEAAAATGDAGAPVEDVLGGAVAAE